MDCRALLALCLLSSSGCSVINAFDDPPVVGKWKARDGGSSTMKVELEGDGVASVFYTVQAEPGVNQKDDFSISWECDDQDSFTLNFRCTGSTLSCTDNSPVLGCDSNGSGDKLDCSTDHVLWRNYQFDWSSD